MPFDRVAGPAADGVLESEPYFGNLRELETSPITSVHLWFDRPVMTLPHVVLVDCVGQWVFNRGEVAPGEHYLQVVVSARGSCALGHDEIERRIVEELRGSSRRRRGEACLRPRW